MRTDRRTSAAFGLLLGVASFLSWTSPTSAQVFFNNQQAAEERDNVFVQPDRELRQLIEGAKEAIQQQRYGDAVDALNQLLVDPQMEDYFLGKPGDATQMSLKADAHRLLGAMPAAGRAAYEQKFGHEARRLLNEAVEQASPDQLSQVARLYFHTQAGMEAAMLLGRYHLNRGRPLAGALWLKRLTEASEQAAKLGPSAAAYSPAAKYDPELSILLAECWLEAGLNDSAVETLVSLKQRLPQAKVRVGDEQTSLFVQDAQALTWLENVLVARRKAGSTREMDWTLFRGNPARNAATAGGFPLPQFIWKTPISNDPGDVETISRIEKSEFRSSQIPALPAGQPLAVGEIVVMRTPEQVIGVDFQQGKRVWLFPPPNSIFDRALDAEDSLPTLQAEDEQRRELKQRIWEDAPYGQLSSDGEAVYFVHDLGFAFEGMRQMLVGQGGFRAPNPKYPKSYNQLVALDLRGEGKLRWIVGGENGENEPRLAGAFFLGPPLPLAGQLYLLAEVNAEIRLVVLDSQSGQLQWAQQLAHVDPSGETILYDVHRRLAGATPSFADGVLVCPTSAGAAVAVDMAARSLLWGYQYQRITANSGGNAGIMIYDRPAREMGERWADGLAVIADGRVLITPVESDHLHCLDLLTGEMVWQQPRGESLFIGGVHNGRAIVVGKTHITAYDLPTGKIAWEQEVGLPTGRGFLSEGDYYQPVYHTSTGEAGELQSRFELVRVNVEKGEVVLRVETDRALGNLVCHRDQIISQGAQWVGALYQVEPLREAVAERLAKNPDDAWAVARQAQLMRHDGQHEESLAALRRAYELDSTDDYTRDLLIDSMLKFLEQDFSKYREFAAEIQKLDPAADQRGEFLRLLIAGYQKTDEPEKAFEACLRLAGIEFNEGVGPSHPPMDQIGAHLTVRRDRWIRARMKELMDAAEGPQRTAIDAAIAARLDEALESDAASTLSRFLNYFGSHPAADRVRLRLAEKLLDSSSLLEAELLLVRLERSADATIAASAHLHLARLMERAQRWSEAAGYYRRMEQRWPDAVVEKELTAAQVVAALPKEGPLALALEAPRVWPAGRVEAKTTEERLANVSSYQKVYPIELTEVRGGLPAGATVAFDQQQSQLIVRDEQGRVLSSIFVTNPHQSMRYPMPSGNNSVYHAKLNGHLLLVSFGVQVMAFNLLEGAQPAGESVLWKEDVDHALDGNISRRSRVTHVPQHNPWGNPRYYATSSNSLPVGRFGPLNEHGVVYQRRSELVCVNPLTGEPIWVRENVEPGSEVFGDDEYIVVIPHSGQQARQAMVLNALDGSLVGQRDVPSRSNRWTNLGRRLLSFQQEGKAMKVRMHDLLEESPQDWERSFAVESKGCLVERDKLAVLQPDGKFVLLALDDGRTLIETDVEPEKSLQSIYVLPSDDQYLLFTNSTYRENSATAYLAPAIPDAPLMNGRIYAFDRQTGQSAWPSPAFVEQWGLPLDQPTGTPVVVLMRREMRKTSGAAQRNVLAILCLDRRNGALLFEKSDLNANAGMGNDKYTLEADPTNNTVNLVLPYLGVTFTFTDNPEPPQPPLESGSLGRSETGVNPVVDAVGAVFRGVRLPGGAIPAPAAQAGVPAAPAAIPPGVRLNVNGQLVPLFPQPPRLGNGR